MPSEYLNHGAGRHGESHHNAPIAVATDHITVLINAISTKLQAPVTLADAVAQLGIQPPFAAAINLQFVPNTRYHQTALQDGDRIDLISPVTGG